MDLLIIVEGDVFVEDLIFYFIAFEGIVSVTEFDKVFRLAELFHAEVEVAADTVTSEFHEDLGGAKAPADGVRSDTGVEVLTEASELGIVVSVGALVGADLRDKLAAVDPAAEESHGSVYRETRFREVIRVAGYLRAGQDDDGCEHEVHAEDPFAA